MAIAKGTTTIYRKPKDAKSLTLQANRQVVWCETEDWIPINNGDITIRATKTNTDKEIVFDVRFDGDNEDDALWERSGDNIILYTEDFVSIHYTCKVIASIPSEKLYAELMIECMLTEKGEKGDTAKPLRGPVLWNATTKFLSGQPNERYQDIVFNPNYPKDLYLCMVSNTNVEPSDDTSLVEDWTAQQPWCRTEFQEFVATKVLFAKRALIENLALNKAKAYKIKEDGTLDVEKHETLSIDGDSGTLGIYDGNFKIYGKDVYNGETSYKPIIQADSKGNFQFKNPYEFSETLSIGIGMTDATLVEVDEKKQLRPYGIELNNGLYFGEDKTYCNFAIGEGWVCKNDGTSHDKINGIYGKIVYMNDAQYGGTPNNMYILQAANTKDPTFIEQRFIGGWSSDSQQGNLSLVQRISQDNFECGGYIDNLFTGFKTTQVSGGNMRPRFFCNGGEGVSQTITIGNYQLTISGGIITNVTRISNAPSIDIGGDGDIEIEDGGGGGVIEDAEEMQP